MPRFKKYSCQVKDILLLNFQVEIPTVVGRFASLSKNATVHTCGLISHSVISTALKLKFSESLASEWYHTEAVVFSGFFIGDDDNAGCKSRERRQQRPNEQAVFHLFLILYTDSKTEKSVSFIPLQRLPALKGQAVLLILYYRVTMDWLANTTELYLLPSLHGYCKQYCP